MALYTHYSDYYTQLYYDIIFNYCTNSIVIIGLLYQFIPIDHPNMAGAGASPSWQRSRSQRERQCEAGAGYRSVAGAISWRVRGSTHDMRSLTYGDRHGKTIFFLLVENDMKSKELFFVDDRETLRVLETGHILELSLGQPWLVPRVSRGVESDATMSAGTRRLWLCCDRRTG